MMANEMAGVWRPFDRFEVGRVPAQPGVFELATETGEVVFIGMAGPKTRLGLRGAIEKELTRPGEARRFRYEAARMFMPRHEELLRAYAIAHGTLPPLNVLRARARMK